MIGFIYLCDFLVLWFPFQLMEELQEGYFLRIPLWLRERKRSIDDNNVSGLCLQVIILATLKDGLEVIKIQKPVRGLMQLSRI